MAIAENLERIRARIDAAARRAGRDPAGVRLIGATKSVAPALIEAAIHAGLTDCGENFVQEASDHLSSLGPGAKQAAWHFIGHLQTNKAKEAGGLFDMIESVDSLRLAQQLSRRSERPLQILLEVNVAAEASKFGFSPSEVASAVSEAGRLANIELVGLMTVAPASSDPELVRPTFKTLRELAQANGLPELSMGMTDDFEIAIEEGATMVRIGRAIFGERPS